MRTILLPLALLALVACGDDDGGPVVLRGAYVIRQADGQPLPFQFLVENTTCSVGGAGTNRREFVAGTFYANDAGADSIVVTLRDTCTPTSGAAGPAPTLTTARTNININGVTICAGGCADATVRGRTATVRLDLFGGLRTYTLERQ